MSKCFCHLNGYEVKDKEARTAISNLNTSVSTAQSTANEAKTAANNAASAASAAQSTANEAKNNAATNATDLSTLADRVTALEGSSGGIKNVMYIINGTDTTGKNTAFVSLLLSFSTGAIIPTTYSGLAAALAAHNIDSYTYGLFPAAGTCSYQDTNYSSECLYATNGVITVMCEAGYIALSSSKTTITNKVVRV